MKIAGKLGKGFTVCCRKKASSTDVHFERGAGHSQCNQCHAVYRNKRWYAGPGGCEAAKKESHTAGAVCPACRRIRDAVPGGIVTLKGSYVQTHKQQLLNLIRNEEGRARGFNPLERVMSVRENSASLVVSTTNEKLAQRIGRAIKKAFRGEVAYNWSRENKLVRVQWERAG